MHAAQTNAGAGGRRRVRAPRVRRGQILVITLLGTILLAGMVVFVFNAGLQTDRTVQGQNAVDSVAVGGATWMARSLNVVAMNNLAQAKLLASCCVLDSLPLATNMAYEEVRAWEQALSDQLDRGVPSSYVREGLESLRDRMRSQRNILAPMDALLNDSGFDMAETTFYRLDGHHGAAPHGRLWRAAVTLAEFSEATIDAAGLLSQYEAVRWGEREGAEDAFLVPILPTVPHQVGDLGDFEPLLDGVLKVDGRNGQVTYRPRGGAGGAIPDLAYPHRLGPYARLLKWRRPRRIATGWVWVPPREGPRVRGGGGSVGVSGRRRGGTARQQQGYRRGHREPTGHETIGYTTYGPVDWALDRVRWYTHGRHEWPHYNYQGELADTYFSDYMRRLTDIKLRYMFRDRSEQRIHRPHWIPSYPDCVQRAQQPNQGGITRTMFYVVEIASSVPEGASGWLQRGTFRTNGDRPAAIWASGWEDPAAWGVLQVANYIWKDSYTYETTEDRQIGIDPIRGSDGRDEWQTVYMVVYYVFGGADLDETVTVRNPCNWCGGACGDPLPRPVLLDTSGGDYDPYAPSPDQGFRRDHFTVLGVTRRSNRASWWAARFRSDDPSRAQDGDHGYMVSLAQAKIFNNTSWDLWTQDWQGRLMPVTMWDDWMYRLEEAAHQAALSRGAVAPWVVEEVHDYLNALPAELAETYLSH